MRLLLQWVVLLVFTLARFVICSVDENTDVKCDDSLVDDVLSLYGVRSGDLSKYFDDVSERCDFTNFNAHSLSGEAFYRDLVKPKVPALISFAMNESDGSLWPAFRNWQLKNLVRFFGDDELFRVGPGPYPKGRMKMSEFMNLEREYKESLREGEAPGLFQYGQVPTSWTIWGHKLLYKYPQRNNEMQKHCIPVTAFMHPNSQPLHDNGTMVCEKILGQIKLPRFFVDETVEFEENLSRDAFEAKYKFRPNPFMITHSGFLVGFKESGIDFHKHQDAINLVFHGLKRWFIKVPKNYTTSQISICNRDDQLLDPIVAKVCKGKPGSFAEVIKTQQITEVDDRSLKILTCIQKPGEIVYIPDYFQHAVVNLEQSVAMQMQWYGGDYKNFAVRRMLQQHLLHALDGRNVDPHAFPDLDELLSALGWGDIDK